MGEPLLRVEDLQTHFATEDGVLEAVAGISYDVSAGEALGIVGESAAGKSVQALSLLRLVNPPGRISGGAVYYKGKDLLRLSERQMQSVRGSEISMIFQDPMTSLNPIKTIGDQMTRIIRFHKRVSERDARDEAVEMLHRVGIPSPGERLKAYPYQFSGGMNQRILIAMALSCEPKLLIADEPTTALDVTVQAEILDLLRELRAKTGTAIILISHDLGVITEFCDRVLVMYAGRIVEENTTDRLFRNPRMPYTQALLRVLPRLDDEERRLSVLPGQMPQLHNMPSGCPFHPRCVHAADPCVRVPPALQTLAPGERVACHIYDPAVTPPPRPDDVTAQAMEAGG
ncbi:MAG: ABC transporter ATP-binding protein [Chloroflexota bacterium]|nr:ABC transporter ATP-binding protein [Chloroflexota bacterium]